MTVTMENVRAVIAPDEPDYESAVRLGPEAVPHLVELMRGDDLEYATKATSLLGMIGDERAVESLRAASQDERLSVRIAVAATAGNLEPAAAAEILLPVLRSPDPVLRKVALQSLPAVQSNPLRTAIESIAGSDEFPEIRALADRMRSG